MQVPEIVQQCWSSIKDAHSEAHWYRGASISENEHGSGEDDDDYTERERGGELIRGWERESKGHDRRRRDSAIHSCWASSKWRQTSGLNLASREEATEQEKRGSAVASMN